MPTTTTTSKPVAPLPRLTIQSFDWGTLKKHRQATLAWETPKIAVELQRRPLGAEGWVTISSGGAPATSPFTDDDAALAGADVWLYRLSARPDATGAAPVVSNLVEVSFVHLAGTWQDMYTTAHLRRASPDALERIADAPPPPPPQDTAVVLAQVGRAVKGLRAEEAEEARALKDLSAGTSGLRTDLSAEAKSLRSELAADRALRAFMATAPSLTAGRSQGKLALSWRAVPEGAEVEILRSETGPDAGFAVVKTTDGTHVAGGLRRRTKVWYKVRFVRAGHRSLASDAVTVQARRGAGQGARRGGAVATSAQAGPQASSTPAAAEALGPTPDASLPAPALSMTEMYDGSYRLECSFPRAVPPGTMLEVHRHFERVEAAGRSEEIDSVEVVEPPSFFAEAAAESRRYRVRAYYRGAHSGLSNEVTVPAAARPDVRRLVPSAGVPASPGSKVVPLHWHWPEGRPPDARVELHVSLTGPSGGFRVAQSDLQEPPFSFDLGEDPAPRWVRIRGFYDKGRRCTALSEAVKIELAERSLLLKQPTRSGGLVHLEWLDSRHHPGVEYVVIRSEPGGAQRPLKKQAGQSFRDSVRAGATYLYRVKVEREDGSTEESNEVRVPDPAHESDSQATQE